MVCRKDEKTQEVGVFDDDVSQHNAGSKALSQASEASDLHARQLPGAYRGWRPALVVGDSGVGAFGQEIVDDLRVAATGCKVQRSAAICVVAVDARLVRLHLRRARILKSNMKVFFPFHGGKIRRNK